MRGKLVVGTGELGTGELGTDTVDADADGVGSGEAAEPVDEGAGASSLPRLTAGVQAASRDDMATRGRRVRIMAMECAE